MEQKRQGESARRQPIYRGEGEEIRPASAPARPVRRPQVVKAANHRQPLGRSEELRERMHYGRGDGPDDREACAPPRQSTIYDDFDAYSREPRARGPRRARRRKDPHRWLWMAVCLLCLAIIAALGVLVAPQVLGVQFIGVPNIAFVNGSIITFDAARYEEYLTCRAYMAGEIIYPGVYIDGVHVGGMTREQAREAVGAASPGGLTDFSVTVQVGSATWQIDPSQVPLSRNVDQVVQTAYAYGRENTTDIRGTRVTPFQERLNAALAMRGEPVSLSTAMTYDREAVRRVTDSIVTFVNREPENASVAAFDFGSRSFTFNSDTPGTYLDGEELYSRVIACLDGGDYHGSVTMEPEMLLADVTKAELMNSFRRVASYTTKTTSNANRNNNIDLSAQAINGTTVLPGETFSFNQATGERTWEKGYREAAAISGGQSVPEVGGGVCQTSSTLFNAVARANLEIVDRSPHAWPSDYVDKGMDATVNWPNLDFVFRNNTQWPIFIVAYYENRQVTTEIYGMGLGDGVTIDLESEVTYVAEPPSEVKYVQNTSLPAGSQKQTIKARKGYEVDTYRVWYKNGEEYQRELLCHSTYRMYQATVEYN